MSTYSHVYCICLPFFLFQLKNSFKKDLALNHLKEAWLFAMAIDSKEEWNELANAALYHLDIQLGMQCL